MNAHGATHIDYKSVCVQLIIDGVIDKTLEQQPATEVVKVLRRIFSGD
jgi:hypothetical protein